MELNMNNSFCKQIAQTINSSPGRPELARAMGEFLKEYLPWKIEQGNKIREWNLKFLKEMQEVLQK